ncbi:MAG: type II toxin-antitoxin system MqsA family antitoxin [Planctomycetes bacterium]|nr:type II toxin-antitoxin system MqsA family antitoxin [Planctomycetota bacterium]
MMARRADGRPCKYERRKVTHTVRHRGRLVVIDHVPAEVCDICGDVLLDPQIVRHIERLLESHREPAGSVPLYEFV